MIRPLSLYEAFYLHTGARRRVETKFVLLKNLMLHYLTGRSRRNRAPCRGCSICS